MSNGKIVAALIAARQACRPTVFKGGENSTQRYAYVGHEHVLVSGARKALLDNGLSLVQVATTFAGAERYATKSGEQTCWRWRGDFVLGHVSGEILELHYEATTGANDKAGFIASTALDRTAHMRVLELAGSSEEDPEHDVHEQRGGQPQPTGDVLADIGADLKQRMTAQELTQWARDLCALRARGDQKKPLWERFAARCGELGLDPSALAADARKAA